MFADVFILFMSSSLLDTLSRSNIVVLAGFDALSLEMPDPCVRYPWQVVAYMKKYVDFFANLSQQDYKFQGYRPSHIAAASIFAARKALCIKCVFLLGIFWHGVSLISLRSYNSIFRSSVGKELVFALLERVYNLYEIFKKYFSIMIFLFLFCPHDMFCRPLWCTELIVLTGYNTEEIVECAEELWKFYENMFPTHRVNGSMIH